MAVRQYVGARYVPKFANPVAWQSGTSYEALTIVTYNNSSYTSKIPVPATVGNPANNDEYWALTGNYNAQVEAYREEAISVQDNLNNEITERKAADNNNSSNITTVKNQLNLKNIVCIGDSYGLGNDGTGSHPELGWPSFLQKITGGNVYNYSVGGSGFTISNNTFLSQLEKAYSEHPDIPLIIIEGGTNDIYSSTAPFNAVTTAINYVKEHFTDAKLYIFINSISCDDTFTVAKKISTWESIKNACVNNSVPFAYLNTFVRFYSGTMGSDYLHMSSYGYQLLAYATYCALIGITPTTFRELTLNTNPDIILKPGIYYSTIYLPKNNETTYSVTKDVSLNGSNAICTITPSLTIEKLFQDLSDFTLVADNIGFTNKSYDGSAFIKFNRGDTITISPYSLNRTSTGVQGFNHLSANDTGDIFFGRGSLTIPSIYFC